MLTDLGERLALIIDAKTDGAISNIRALSAEEKAAADRADILKAKISDLEARSAKGNLSASATSRLINAKNELSGLEASLAKVPAGSGAAEKALARLGLQGTATGAALATGVASAGLAVLAFGELSFFKSGVEHYIELANQIRTVQQAAGGTTEDASRLVAVTQALGVSSDTAALGVFRLGKNIELAPQKLSAYGIEVARTNTGNVDLIGTLGNVAAAYQRTQDPAKRAALVFEAFGRAGTSMLPILNANRQQLVEIGKEAAKQGRIFNPQDLAQARDFQIQMRQLKDSWDALGITAGKTLVPALTSVANAFTTVLNSMNSKRGNALLGGLIPIYGITAGLFHHHAAGASKAAQELAQAQQDAITQSYETAAAATLGGTSSLLASPGQGLADARQHLSDATQTVRDAIAEQRNAVRALAQLKSQGARGNTSAVDAATARVQAAQAALRAAEYVGGDVRTTRARASLLTAQKELNTARAQGGTDTNKLASATERLNRANEKVASAQRAERQARAAKERATGLSGGDILGDLRAQVKDKTALTQAQATLVGKGASADLIAYIDKQNQQLPGTLAKAAKSLTAGMVSEANAALTQVGAESDIYTKMAGDPDSWRAAGASRGKQFANGFAGSLGSILSQGLPHKASQASGHYFHDSQPLATPRYVFTGPISVKGNDPGAIVDAVAAESRKRALSGMPRNASL